MITTLGRRVSPRLSRASATDQTTTPRATNRKRLGLMMPLPAGSLQCAASHRDFVPGALWAGQPGVGLRVAGDLLFLRVPRELSTAQTDRDVREVAGGERAVMRPDIGHGHCAVA